MSPLNKIAMLLSLAVFMIGISLHAQMQDETINKEVLTEFLQNEAYIETIQYLKSKNTDAFTDVFAINALGYAYFMSRNYLDAEQYYSRTLLIDSLNFSANRYMALLSRQFKKFEHELFYYKRLIRLRPGEAMIYKLTADAYIGVHRPDSALVLYRIAYFMQPSNETIASAIVEKLIENKVFATADSVGVEFLKRDVLNPNLTRLLIKSYMTQKRMADAAALTNKWLSTNEIDTRTTVNLSMANYSVRNYQAAFKVCDTLLQQGVESEALLYYAALAKYKLNDFNTSVQLLHAGLDLGISKNVNLYYFALADNYEETGDYKRCIRAYDTAFYLFKDPLALYNIGRIYEQHVKNDAMARQYYTQYLSISKPTTDDEKKVINYVKQVLGKLKKQ